MIYIDFDDSPKSGSENFLVERFEDVYTFKCDYCFATSWKYAAQSKGSVRLLLGEPPFFQLKDAEVETAYNYIAWLRSLNQEVSLLRHNGRNKMQPPIRYALEYSYSNDKMATNIYFDLCLMRFLTYEFCPRRIGYHLTAKEQIIEIFSRVWVTKNHMPFMLNSTPFALTPSPKLGLALFQFFDDQRNRQWSGKPMNPGTHLSADIDAAEFNSLYYTEKEETCVCWN